MRNFTLLFLVFITFNGFTQDTTAFNLIGINTNGGLDYFDNDSISMGQLTLSTDFEDGFSIFQNPINGVLYAILYKGLDNPTERNLYSINPLSGDYTLVKTFTNKFINSADIAPDGTVYFITGNGNVTNPNTLHTFNIDTGVETFLSNPILNGSRGLEFNPLDSTLYLFEGYTDILCTFNLATNVADTFNTTGLYDEIHGAYFDEVTNTFLISAYGGEMYITDNSYLNGTLYHNTNSGVTGNNLMDLEKVKFIQGAATRGFCAGDSVQISAYFSGVNYKWYKDGVEISNITDTFVYAKIPGVYKALMEVTMDEQVNYLWSEEITVSQFAIPNVVISSAGNDTEICPTETILLTGANGGTLQWYLNNAPISGANASTYAATQAGIYNQMKTNTSGCFDTSHVDFVITVDANCTTGLNEITANTFQVYPNPSYSDLTILNSFNGVTAYSILDLTGKTIQSGELVSGLNTINLKALNAGVYLINVNGYTKRLVKK